MKITAAFKRQATVTEFHPNFSMPTLLAATKMIQAEGYKLREKRRNSFAASMTTTDVLTKTVWLKHGWNKREDSRNTATLYHELVHILQAKAWGNVKFARRYASPRWRWAIEMQAYAVSILVQRSMGANVSEMPANIAKILAAKYGPWLAVPKSEVRNATMEVLSALV